MTEAEGAAHAVVRVVVDGELEEETTFYDQVLLDHYLDGVREDAIDHGYPTEVHVDYQEPE